MRAQDTVARIGGDEFVVILPRLSAHDELEVVAERLVERIEEPIEATGPHRRASQRASGSRRFDPAADDARSLLVKSDVAMYAAKKDPAHPWLVHYDGMPVPEGRLDK